MGSQRNIRKKIRRSATPSPRTASAKTGSGTPPQPPDKSLTLSEIHSDHKQSSSKSSNFSDAFCDHISEFFGFRFINLSLLQNFIDKFNCPVCGNSGSGFDLTEQCKGQGSTLSFSCQACDVVQELDASGDVKLDLYEAAKNCENCSTVINQRTEVKTNQQHEDILGEQGVQTALNDEDVVEDMIVPFENTNDLLTEQHVINEPNGFENIDLKLECESVNMMDTDVHIFPFMAKLNETAEETVHHTQNTNHCQNNTLDFSVRNDGAHEIVKIEPQAGADQDDIQSSIQTGNSDNASIDTLAMDCSDSTDPQFNCNSSRISGVRDFLELPGDVDSASKGQEVVDNVKKDLDNQRTQKQSKPGTSQEMVTEEKLSFNFKLNDGKNSSLDVKYKPFVEVILIEEELKSLMVAMESTTRAAGVESITRAASKVVLKTFKYRCKACLQVFGNLKDLCTHVLHKEIADIVNDDPEIQLTQEQSKSGTTQEMVTEKQLSENERSSNSESDYKKPNSKSKNLKDAGEDNIPNYYVLNDGKNSLIPFKYKPYIGVLKKAESSKRRDEISTAVVQEDARRIVKYCCKVCGYVSRGLGVVKSHVINKEMNASCKFCGMGFSKLGLKLHERKDICQNKVCRQSVIPRPGVPRKRRERTKSGYPLYDGKNSRMPWKYKPFVEVIHEGEEQKSLEGKRNVSETMESTITTAANKDVKKTVKYRCKVCRLVFGNVIRLQTHVLHKELAESVLCHLCGKSFSNLGIKHHVSKGYCLREKKMYHCSYKDCKYSVRYPSHLKSHIYTTHTNRGSFVCTWEGCGMKLNRSDTLRRHIKTHTGEKPIVCYLCGFRCLQKSSLNWHMKSKHPGKPVQPVV